AVRVRRPYPVGGARPGAAAGHEGTRRHRYQRPRCPRDRRRRERAVTARGPLVVVGDTVLDRDIDGDVHRVCPDAPVPVLEQQSAVDRPGGAGLAAVLAAADGNDVVLVTGLADDAAGDRLRELFADAGVTVHALPLAGATPEK